jgi:cathepsin C
MVGGTLIMSRLFLSLFLLSSLVYGDLPIHCRNEQVAGEWIFSRGAANSDNSQSCGMPTPDNNAYHFTHSADIKFDVDKSLRLTVTLTQPNIATAVDQRGVSSTGTWTMVYDEGFEVNIGGFSYFAFMKYKPRKKTQLTSDEVSDYISYCDKTMVGWYHDTSGSRWGCFRGAKSKSSGGRSSSNRKKKQKKNRSKFSKLRSKNMIEIESESNDDSENDDNSEIHHYNIVSPISRRADADSLFSPDYSLIERQNSDRNSLWVAGVHQHFVGKPMTHMMKLLGARNYRKGWGETVNVNGGNGAVSFYVGPGALPHSAQDIEEYKTLPTSFSWREKGYDSPVRNQGECGSCYAVAAVSVMESRVNIKRKNTNTENTLTFSPQSVVSCSRYNQACDGGYPFLVGKHGEDFGFVEEKCFPYEGTNSQCGLECPGAKRYKVKNHHYIGGYYGGCSELAMMKEIQQGGPVVVAFQAPSSLFSYTGGIYTGPSPKTEGKAGHQLNIWEQTNHAVVAVGWGVDGPTGTKYWEIKNTWGVTWGEGGYFRIRRGTDECGIESMASAFDVVDF